jgi:hypothetical protein
VNLLVVGNSEKFIKFVESLFPISHTCVIGWRGLPLSIEKQSVIADTKWDLCLVSGYDYGSATYFYDKYLASNVENIMQFLHASIAQDTQVVYVNTMAASKRYTFSRYLFAKMLLGDALVKSYPKTIALEFSTVNESGKILTKGGLLSKFGFWLLNYLGRLSMVIINESPSANLTLFQQLEHKPFVPSPRFLKIPRPLIVDRCMRLILG